MAYFAAPQPHVIWQWEDDGQMWSNYDPNDSTMIEMSYMSGSPRTAINSAVGGRSRTGATYDVDFSTMQQVNRATTFGRKVRRNVDVTHVCRETWLWQNGGGFQPVPLRVCAQMVVSRDSRREASTVAHLYGDVYEFVPAQLVAIHTPSGSQIPLRTVGSSSQGAPAGAGPTDRQSEYQGVLNSARDCTTLLGADETCAVCIDGFSPQEPALLLPQCSGHYMHGACVLEVFKAMGPKCPTCSAMYGTLQGDQPDGTMSVRTHRRGAMPLSGYDQVGTIVIQYSFPNGTQGPRHPNTGQRYHGTSRVAYLPDNAEGNGVLALLRKSFAQKMTFTVGTSITTGRSDCVVWNGVHHKTNVSGGSSHFGYPDPGYFARVKGELAAKGIS